VANCADCGRNPKRGCLPTCPRDKTVSVWARYRARKKAARTARTIAEIVAEGPFVAPHQWRDPLAHFAGDDDAGPPVCPCGQLPAHIRHGNDGKPRIVPASAEAVEYGGPRDA